MFTNIESLKTRATECRQKAQELIDEANGIDQLLGLSNVDSVLRLLGSSENGEEMAAAPKSTKSAPGRKSTKPAPARKSTTKPAKVTGQRGPRGPRSQPSLRSLIVEVLTNQKDGMTLAEIVKEILKKGYKSTAENFSIVVYQNLYQLSKKSEVGHKDHKYSLTKAA